jgi:flavin-binding protein dodecin
VGGGGAKRRRDGCDLRVAEVTRTDVTIENGKVSGYRVRLNISFKYESND